MADTYAFPYCPLRARAHLVADRSAGVRALVRALWPAARRAESVELSDAALHVRTLAGDATLRWDEIRSVGSKRTLLGRRTLRVTGPSAKIAIAPIIPGYIELERRVLARLAAASAPAP